jgi:hypothetical protein
VDSEGKIRKMGNDKTYFYMEPNSIVYVSSAEKLNLPFYIVARFNLRVKWVYKGILLGTGPQVDPGFKGNLSCPLFNLTDRAVRIKLDEMFATIDFERTSDFCEGKPWDEVIGSFKVGEELDEVIVGAERFLMFKQKSFSPLKHLPDHDVLSSLAELSKDVRTWRNIGVAAVVAFLSLALTLLNFQNNLYRDNRALTDQVTGLRERVTSLEGKPLANIDARQAPVSPQSPTAPAIPKKDKKNVGK